MLEMFAPITFPAKISEEPLFTEIIPEINSGKDVPIPTIKTPMTKLGKLKYFPIVSADFVKNLADFKSPISASINMI